MPPGRARSHHDAQRTDAAKPRSHSLSAKQAPEPTGPKGLRCCRPQILACLAAGMFNVPEGLTMAYSSSLIPELQEEGSEIPITLEQGVLLGSCMVACMAMGTLISGVVMNRFGRLNTVRFSFLPFAAGWFVVASASTYEQILVGRLLTGLANSLGINGAIMFVTEVAPSHLRGALNATQPTMASIGIVLGYVLGAVTRWRLSAWISGASPFFVVVLMQLVCYESPIWLVSKGRVEEARRSLRAYARCYDTEDAREKLPERQLEWLIQRRDCSEAQVATKVPWYRAVLDLFTQPEGYRPLLILFVVFAAQNLSGIYITLFYAAPFFKEMGVEVDAFQAAVLIGLMRLVMGLVAVWLLGNVSVRKLMTTSSLGMGVCMLLSGYFTLRPEHGLHGWVPVVLVLVYVAMSCCGLMTVPWTMPAELYPDHLRDAGQSFTVFSADLLMFSVLQLYPTLLNGLQFGEVTGTVGIQWFFAAVSLANVVFVVVFLPETHGRSLQELQEHYQLNTMWLWRTKTRPADTESGNNVSTTSTVTACDSDLTKT
ncbi:facilitated trehalose transporter Tret1-like [Thrips palmi]|uniref:Facilitated trehalose transporter Tret1-like n=1 Tax=Thrips palmi TaxID=161013 RepID=A0A6P9A0Q3_THRPL|nr:facilitated trehalose transporter Tret1-like [Thrips palmi]